MTALVWIQREFRVDYLPALQNALKQHSSVVVAYFHDSHQETGSANDLWLGVALQNLAEDYKKRGGQLAIISGAFEDQFSALLTEFNIRQVYYSYQTGEVFFKNQALALDICKRLNIGLTPSFSESFFEPFSITNQQGNPYLVFTPYYKNLLKRIALLEPLEPTRNDLKPTKLKGLSSDVPQTLLDLQTTEWAEGLLSHWRIGEGDAWQCFENFFEHDLDDYANDRDYPSIDATSRLSPYLHFGHINATAIYFYLQSESAVNGKKAESIQPWVRQLVWRDFARYLLACFPDKEKQPFNDKYVDMRWQKHTAFLERWQTGQTGIPIIDAGMRELWATGTMHNRVRMLVASVLTKNLNIDWRHGLEWFEYTLFDADPANNSMGWQWVAGCGVDASPYYRLFNPVLQGQKFDGRGEYIKKWVPELKALSEKAVHEPWEHQLECLANDIQLGRDYPEPIVDLKQSRQAHLERVEQLKQA